MDQTTLLFAGEFTTAFLQDGSQVPVRVKKVPTRHLLGLIDLFEQGRESELLERTLQVVETPAATPLLATYKDASAEFIDSLDDEHSSYEGLVDLVSKLNFTRAVSLAERQIAMGQKLTPLKAAQASVLVAPVRRELESLISSLTTAISGAAAAKKPSAKP